MFVDGATKEEYPLTPFMDKKPHEITCIQVKIAKVFHESIDTPKKFVDILVRSALSNRVTYDIPIELVNINVGQTDVFNFNMSYEEKVKLYNLGYSTR